MDKAIGILIAVLVVIVSALLFNSYRLSNKVENTEKDLRAEQATNVALGNIIDAYSANEAANRAATDRQLENERKLRNESDERLRRFKASAASDDCSIKPLPDASIIILQE